MGDVHEDIYKFSPLQCAKLKARNSKREPVVWNQCFDRIFADSNNIYVFEERWYDTFWADETEVKAHLFKFNLATRKWTAYKNLRNLPDVYLLHMFVVLCGNVLMIYGDLEDGSTNNLYACDLNNCKNGFYQIVIEEPPLPHCGSVLVYKNEFLYTIGGGTKDKTYTCDILRLSLKTFIWEIVTQGNEKYKPIGRFNYEVFYNAENFVLLGGHTEHDEINLCEITIFDIEKKLWTKRKTIRDENVTHNGGFPSHSNGKFLGTFQIIPESNPQLAYEGFDNEIEANLLWKLDLKTFQWTLIYKRTFPYWANSSTVGPDGRYCVFPTSYNTTTDDVLVTWLGIPKLSKICLDAVLHYAKVFDKDALVNAGVPKCYVDCVQS